MKTTMRTLIVILLAFLLLFPQAVIVPEALAAGENLEAEADDVVTIVNEFTVTQAVNAYFQGRKAFLTSGDTAQFAGAVPAIVEDELTHVQMLAQKGIVLLSSLIQIDDIQTEELYAVVHATELLTYRTGDTTVSAEVTHRLFVGHDYDGQLIVGSDRYLENLSGFASCSYPMSTDPVAETMAAGSSLCIKHVAEGEYGEGPDAQGLTKYERWMKVSGDWCSMFVCWCANECNLSQSIVPHSSWAPTIRTFYESRGLFYASQIHDSSVTQTPQIGDFIFESTMPSGAAHIAIVVTVYSGSVRVIEGNAGDKVHYRTITLSDPSYVGFARPQYPSTSHTTGSWVRNASGHYRTCVNCGISMTSLQSHVNSVLQYDSNKHWRYCVTCNYTTFSEHHTMEQVGAISKCSVCGYREDISINGAYRWYIATKEQ